MAVQFGILDEELEKHLIRFLLAREAYKRGELPDETLMDKLWEFRSSGGPQKAYDFEKEHGEKNLDMVVRLVTNKFHSRTPVSRDIETGEGPRQVLFFDDPQNPILYEMRRVKELARLSEKSMDNIDSQNQTGFNDQKAARLILESPEARGFRSRREYRNLSSTEKKKFRELFRERYKQQFKEGRFEALSEHEKRVFYSKFTVDFHGLTSAEKKKYDGKFQELHRKMARNIVQKIVSDPSFDSIPIAPHYVRINNLPLRIQRQIITDSDGNRIADFEYIIKQSGQQTLFEEGLYKTARKSCVRLENILDEGANNSPGKRNVHYYDRRDRESWLVDRGDIIINFHIEPEKGVSTRDIAKIIRRISRNYRDALKEHSGEEDYDDKDTKILKKIRLGMGDMPSGFFIYSNTRTRGLEDIYDGLEFTENGEWKTFVKDRMGDRMETNGYEDVKFYLALGDRGICAEFQIMDPIMFEKAEWGSARRPKFREEKRGRHEKDVEDLTKDDREFALALFGSGQDSDRALSRVMSNYFSERINSLVDEIKGFDTIQPLWSSETFTKESDRFYELVGEIGRIAGKAKGRIKAEDKSEVMGAVSGLLHSYIMSRGMGLISYLDSIVAINESLKQVLGDSGSSGIDGLFVNEIELQNALHSRHINLMMNAYKKLASSDKDDDKAVAVFVEYVIHNYNSYYGRGKISAEVQREYRRQLEDSRKNKEFRAVKKGKHLYGHAPAELTQSIKNLTLTKFRESLYQSHLFDQATANNVLAAFNSYSTKH